MLLKNERDDEVYIELDCEESENCVSNQQPNKQNRLFTPIVHIRGNKQKIGVFLIARNENKDWFLRCAPRLIR